MPLSADEVQLIIDVVYRHVNVPKEHRFLRSKKYAYTYPRQLCMLLLSRGGLSQESIGFLLGMDRSSVSYGSKKIRQRLRVEPAVKEDLAAVLEKVCNHKLNQQT